MVGMFSAVTIVLTYGSLPRDSSLTLRMTENATQNDRRWIGRQCVYVAESVQLHGEITASLTLLVGDNKVSLPRDSSPAAQNDIMT